VTDSSTVRRAPRWLTVSSGLLAFGAVVVALMLWLGGAFNPKVPHTRSLLPDSRPIGAARVVEVIARTIAREETSVGTIDPVHRVKVASRIIARVTEVNAVAGQRVARGDVLVRLEDTDLSARRAQAQSAVTQAEAVLDQARIEEARLRGIADKKAIAAVDLDRAVNALKGAEAGLKRAKEAETEAATVLEYATIRSPIDGTVVDKQVNRGDTVSPGQSVVTLLDPTRMQLVASVRESLSRRLQVGQSVSVKIAALDHACSGIVSEIVPEAESASRTFQVKVTGPCPPGVYAGMFGRLSIPVGEESILLIPNEAVHTVGQVQFVDVAVGGARARRAVRLGRVIEDQVEVLSGLTLGERVVVDASGGR
jgi:RND family efflux transporter MFP subunit